MRNFLTARATPEVSGIFAAWPEQIVRDYIDGGTVDFLDGKQVRLACTPGWEAANYRAGAPNLWKQIGELRDGEPVGDDHPVEPPLSPQHVVQ